MLGAIGNDYYIVDNTKDLVVEKANEGKDSVESSVSYTLPNNTENLLLTNTNSINGTGNSLSNAIVGNSANNILKGLDGKDNLNGGAGDDILFGGKGNDRFIFSNKEAFTPANFGVDTIADFEKGDTITLSKTAFTALIGDLNTKLPAGNFIAIDTDLNNEVEQASLKSAAIVYNSGTGNLFYNENGSESGLGNGSKFATIDGAIALSNDDFFVTA